MGLKSPLRISTAFGWYVGATQVTPSAAELNILYGVTCTAAELNILHGVTGVVAADITNIGGLDVDLDTLTSTAAELNILHGVTGVSATDIGNIGGLSIDLDNLTSTAAELNILHGVTGVAATAISNIGGLDVDLDNLTSDATELNMLDGLTALINAETAGWNVNKGRILGFTATVSNVAHGMSGVTGLYMFFQPWLGATPETFDGANQAHFFQWETRGSASFDVYGFTASADAGSVALVGLDWLAVGLK